MLAALGDGTVLAWFFWIIIALAVLVFSLAALIGVAFLSFQGATWGAKVSAAWGWIKTMFGK